MRVPTPVLDPSQAPAPLPGQPLDVVVAGGWRLPVRVRAATQPGDVRLEPLTGDATMPGEVEACRAALEWRSARGLVRREGVLRTSGDAFVLTDAAEAVVMQRRNFARVRAAVRVAVVGAEDSELVTRTVDLSIGGMLVENAALLGVGERVRWVLNLPDDVVLHGEGEVVRATQFGHRAVRFDELRHADEQRLARYVMAQEREGRSAAAYAGR